jgi:hypothetical protein
LQTLPGRAGALSLAQLSNPALHGLSISLPLLSLARDRSGLGLLSEQRRLRPRLFNAKAPIALLCAERVLLPLTLNLLLLHTALPVLANRPRKVAEVALGRPPPGRQQVASLIGADRDARHWLLE